MYILPFLKSSIVLKFVVGVILDAATIEPIMLPANPIISGGSATVVPDEDGVYLFAILPAADL